MRLVVTTCTAVYSGRLNASLPLAKRLIVVKADGSVLLHSDGGSYKPLNWMSPPCSLKIMRPDTKFVAESDDDAGSGATEYERSEEHVVLKGETEVTPLEVWTVQHAKSDDRLVIELYDVEHDSDHDLGVDPGLIKEGVEAHLQQLLAEQLHRLGEGHSLVRREYPTAIGPVDILARAPGGGHVAVEIKRRGEIDGVEQLTRYLELLERDTALAPVRGVFAAQEIKPQARVLAADRGIECLLLDLDDMRGLDDVASRLF